MSVSQSANDALGDAVEARISDGRKTMQDLKKTAALVCAALATFSLGALAAPKAALADRDDPYNNRSWQQQHQYQNRDRNEYGYRYGVMGMNSGSWNHDPDDRSWNSGRRFHRHWNRDRDDRYWKRDPDDRRWRRDRDDRRWNTDRDDRSRGREDNGWRRAHPNNGIGR